MTRPTFLLLLVPAVLAGCPVLAIVDSLTPESGYRLVPAVAYGNLPHQVLDIYVPVDGDRPYPEVVFFYAGRWIHGARFDNERAPAHVAEDNLHPSLLRTLRYQRLGNLREA